MHGYGPECRNNQLRFDPLVGNISSDFSGVLRMNIRGRIKGAAVLFGLLGIFGCTANSGFGTAYYQGLSDGITQFVAGNFRLNTVRFYVNDRSGLNFYESDLAYIDTFIERGKGGIIVQNRNQADAIINIDMEKKRSDLERNLITHTIFLSLETGPALNLDRVIPLRNASRSYNCLPNLRPSANLNCRRGAGVPLALAMQDLSRI